LQEHFSHAELVSGRFGYAFRKPKLDIIKKHCNHRLYFRTLNQIGNMAVPALKYASIEAYLVAERAATEKHEYYKGEVFAMSGASLRHNKIQVNLTGEIRNFLRGKSCDVFGSDLRVHIPSNSLFTYPDVVIICGEPQLMDHAQDTVLNPAVIFEVLSPSTQSYDRGDKFKLYRDIPSLKEYILVASDKPGIEHYLRQPDDRWTLQEFDSMEAALLLPTIGCNLPLVQIYEGVTFP
jgi:Uma2 family endonuclease